MEKSIGLIYIGVIVRLKVTTLSTAGLDLFNVIQDYLSAQKMILSIAISMA
jgi:hypothetical protein